MTRDTVPQPASDISERVHQATALLDAVAADRTVLESLPLDARKRFFRAIAAVYSPDRVERRRMVKHLDRERRAARVKRDQAVLHETGIRTLRRQPVFTTPNVFPPEGFQPQDVPPASEPAAGRPRESAESQHCYVCKQHYTVIHHFYDQLCPACAEFNLGKRTETADLRGRVALLTGGRVKIGYQAGLKLLRAGAHLIVTTRFPRDSAARYAQEADFDHWKDRLEIFGLDLRHTPSVEVLCRHLLSTRSRLDFLINNACQTVRRPPAFYAHMLDRELAATHHSSAPERRLLESYEALRALASPAVSAGLTTVDDADEATRAVAGLVHAARLSQVPLEDAAFDAQLFPTGQLDQDAQQVDLRERNSWRLLLHEVSSIELLEVHLVNAVAPFVLNARLKALMLRTPDRDKHIVNVSAVEGQFYRNFKTTRHPHTNMAKAALNMMTRTAAADYHADGIHMNSVDTGWVTDEDPEVIAARKTTEQRFHPPLDIVDGGARIVDPIIDGIKTGRHMWGQFLKDYRPTDW